MGSKSQHIAIYQMCKWTKISGNWHSLAKPILTSFVITQIFVAGCQNRQSISVLAEQDGSSQDESPVMLSPRDEMEVVDLMRSLAGEGGPLQVPVAGPPRGRWSDVPAAARAAAARQEFVIVRSHMIEGCWVFEFRSAGDRPAELRVEQRPGEEVYAATATVGLFRDRTDQAEQLYDAFEKAMRAFSRKRKYPEPSD